MKKKGFTLVELMVTLGILSIIITMGLQFFCYFVRLYGKETSYNKEILNQKESIMFIENEINDKTQYVKIDNKNSVIKIYKFNGIDSTSDILEGIEYYAEIEYIKVLDGKLVILYGNSIVTPTDRSYKNIIIEDVKSFKVIHKNKLIYIQIENNGGAKFERCLVVKNIR